MRLSVLCLVGFLSPFSAAASIECEFFLEGEVAESPAELIEQMFNDVESPGFASLSLTVTPETLKSMGLPRRLPTRLRLNLVKVPRLQQGYAIVLSGPRREWTRYTFHLPPVFLWHWVENGAVESPIEFASTSLDKMSLGTVMITGGPKPVRQYVALQINSLPERTLVVTVGIDVHCEELSRYSQADPRPIKMMFDPQLSLCRVEVIRARLGLSRG